MTIPRALAFGSVRAALAVLAFGPATTGCSPEGTDERSLYELERMAFVPAIPRSRLIPYWGLASDLSIPEPLLVDRFEVTHADVAHYELRSDTIEGLYPADLDPRVDWPAPLSYREAERLAELRGMRLLTPREWVQLAVGPRGHAYPWGPNFQTSVANTRELGLGRPAAVGTFERSRSEPYGCYDMLGNVWEWVDGIARGVYDEPKGFVLVGFEGDRASLTGSYFVLREGGVRLPLRGDLATAMGGSYLAPAHETYVQSEKLAKEVESLQVIAEPEGVYADFHAITLHVDHAATDIGARMGIEAREWLLAKASGWRSDASTRERLRAVGGSWGRSSLDFLEALLDEEGAPSILAELLEGARATIP